MPGIIQQARRPPGWVAPGPQPAGDLGRPELQPRDDEDLCYLVGDWRIFQKQRGHRWSLDDLVTAWLASKLAPAEKVHRHVDLGCGIGSVLLMTSWKFPNARSLGIEAQPVSYELARRSVAWNGAEERVEVRHGDLRDPALLPEGPVFDLVTGTPPYFYLGAGTLSEKVQASPARFETRGGIEAYCEAASRALAPDGTFVVVEAYLHVARVFEAARAHGLSITHQLDVIPRAGKAALISVFGMKRPGAAEPFTGAASLVVRDEAGRRTPEFIALRADMGMPP